MSQIDSFTQGCFDHGRARAIQSGAIESRDADIEPLQAHARAAVRGIWQPAFDPEKNADDAIRAGNHASTLNEIATLKARVPFAERAWWDARAAYASMPEVGHFPGPRIAVFLCLVAVFAVSVAPTIHDLFGDTDAQGLAWCAAAAIALTFGGAVLGAMILAVDEHGRRTVASKGSLIGGIVVGVGLGLIRCSAAETGTEIVLAVGLTIIELATVIISERMATDLVQERAHWAGGHDARTRAASAEEVARAEYVSIQERATALEARVQAHISYVDDRSGRSDLRRIEDIAVRATMDGYSAGTGYNRGRLLGVRQPS